MMATNKYTNLTNTFAQHNRCFTIEDLLIFTEEELDRDILIQTIEDDPRFLQTCEQTAGRKYFIAKNAIYRWYINLNIRLAQANTFKLSNPQLAKLINALYTDSSLNSIPVEYTKFGQQLCLISPTTNPNEYVFPVAKILSFMSPSNITIAKDFLHNFPTKKEWASSAEKIVTWSINNALNRFSNKERYIISRRQGLFGTTEMTLEQIGQNFSITRERVRQLEKRCWKRMWHPLFRRAFIAPLLSYVLRNNGSLIVSPDRLKPEIKFFAKCLNIPIAQFPHTDLLILGGIAQRLEMPKDIWRSSLNIDTIASHFQSSFNITLPKNDMLKIAEALSIAFLSQLTKSQKVYLTLKQLGRPAHFERVAETLNALFPEDHLSEHNVHAILTRQAYGIVWIGIKGTYALKEWGYERPSSTLFDTVTDIVERKYAETGKPVPFLIIQAEIGKYRKIVNPNSIVFAAYLNENLLCVNEDYFTPKPAGESEAESSAKELDSILEKFERRRKGLTK